jgi:hypothetical protein
MRINEIIDNNSNPIDEDWNDEVNANYIKYRETNPYYNPNQKTDPVFFPTDDPLMGPWDKAGMTKDALRAAQEKIIGKNEEGVAAYDAALGKEIDDVITELPGGEKFIRRAEKREREKNKNRWKWAEEKRKQIRGN